MATITLLGAVNGTRTRDPRLGKPMLYQLSYYRVVSACEDTTFILMWVAVLIFLQQHFSLWECFAAFKYLNGLQHSGVAKVYVFHMLAHSKQLVGNVGVE